MKQVMIGVFAHPDDESFGPSGTLLTLARSGVDIHLILLTDGEAGANPHNAPDLGKIRLDEWNRATELIGATSTVALHFPDGELCHSMHIAIGAALHAEVHRIYESYAEPIELSFMTFDQNGLTGHMDHIATSYLTTHQFYSLKNDTPQAVTMGRLWYYCLSRDHAPEREWTDYYMPIGRDPEFITDELDVSPVLNEKIALFDIHQTQVNDADTHKKLGPALLSRECFHITN